MYITVKKARSYVNQYNRTPYRTIHDCYKRPSNNKIAAWGYCLRKCGEMDGHNITVLSFNTSFSRQRGTTHTPTPAFSCSTSKHTPTATTWKCEV